MKGDASQRHRSCAAVVSLIGIQSFPAFNIDTWRVREEVDCEWRIQVSWVL